MIRRERPHDQTAYDKRSDEERSENDFRLGKDFFESVDSEFGIEVGEETEDGGGYFGETKVEEGVEVTAAWKHTTPSSRPS